MPTQTRQATMRQENYAGDDENVTKVQGILLRNLLSSSKNRTLSNNILRVQEFVIVKSKSCLRDLLNKT